MLATDEIVMPGGDKRTIEGASPQDPKRRMVMASWPYGAGAPTESHPRVKAVVQEVHEDRYRIFSVVFKAMKWSISLSLSWSMGATQPASPSQHYIINRGLLVKSACFPTSSWLHPRVPSGCVFESLTL